MEVIEDQILVQEGLKTYFENTSDDEFIDVYSSTENFFTHHPFKVVHSYCLLSQ